MRLADPPDHVEVGQRGLDHHHVGALVLVQARLPDGLARVGRVHLVAAAVAHGGRGVGRLAERAVEGGGELRAVGDDRRLGQAVLVERGAQRPDAPVHHVARRHGVRAGLGLRDGGAGEQLERLVVVDHAVRPQHAAVAVARVLAQAEVGDHEQVRVRGLDRARGELDHALVVVGAGAELVLGGREAEQQHGGDPERVGDPGLLDRAVDAQVVDPRQRRDRRALLGAGDHEHRIDEVRGRQLRLAREPAQRRGRAHAAHAGCREGHGLRV